MSNLSDEERERIFTEGRWYQAVADTERCVEIFNLPEAKLRPITAWQLLPQGFEVSSARSILQSVPVEDAEMQAVWPDEMAKLNERLVSVTAKFKLWSAELETCN